MRRLSERTIKAMASAGRLLAIAGAGWMLSGCGEPAIQVYTVPKEDPWFVPPGWVEQKADGMRAAKFTVPTTNGPDIDVSVIPIRGFTASHADVLNIWRQQMQLDPISGEAEAAKLAEKVKLGPDEGDLFDMTSLTNMLDGQKARTMVAVLRKDGTLWLVKMTGAEPGVDQEKPRFLSFLKSMHVNNIPAPQRDMASADGHAHGPGDGHDHGEESAPARPEWQVPDGWVEQPRPRMLNAKFVVSGNGGAKADINVSVLNGDGGGLLMNINRWREQQLGLGAWNDPDVQRNAKNIDGVNGKAVIVDFTGTDTRTRQPARLIGAIVPVDGQTWFYKLMGDVTVVEREKDSFIKFVSTAKHPNG